MRIKWFSLIRVTGLVMVLLYHFFLKYFPGGFVGVDIFFTFSGFLVTALFIDEFTRSKKIDLQRFFHKRLYRILPALVLMIVVITPLALLVRRDFLASIGNQIIASLGMVSNIFEIMAGNGYENQFTPHLLVHTWTLAVEVHFYIIWALAIWGMSKLAKTVGQLRGMIFLISSLLFLASFLSMFVSSFLTKDFSSIYFSSWTHSFPFFMGAILATLVGVAHPNKAFLRVTHQWDIRKSLTVFGGALVLLLALTFLLKFNSIWPYLIGFLLASVATAVMIYSTRVLHEQTPTIQEPKVLTFISDISYGIYLFHWPLFIIFSQKFSNLPAVLLTTLLSVFFASLSLYVIEPYIAGKTIKLLNLNLNLKPYGKWFVGSFAFLSLTTLVISLTAPKVGSFEKEMIISNLQQADNQMMATRTAAENAKATNYNIQKGVTIFGDSVTVRANAAIQNALPDAQIDGTVSRHLTEISGLIKLYKSSNSLRENVVVALGTNSSENFKELLDALISEFPRGHRLIFVTPYDGNYATPEESIVYQTGQYEKKLSREHDYIIIADWFQASVDNPGIWAGTDKVHFNLETNGAELLASTIKNALEKANTVTVKK